MQAVPCRCCSTPFRLRDEADNSRIAQYRNHTRKITYPSAYYKENGMGSRCPRGPFKRLLQPDQHAVRVAVGIHHREPHEPRPIGIEKQGAPAALRDLWNAVDHHGEGLD